MNPLIPIAGGVALVLWLFKSVFGSSKTNQPQKELPPTPDSEEVDMDFTDDPEVIRRSEVTPEDEAEIDEVIKEEEATKLPGLLKSPFAGVSNEQWTKYVKLSKKGGVETYTPGGSLGMFLFNMRTLQDYGLTKNVHKDAKGIWRGDWVATNSQAKFLKDAALQYKVFLKYSMDCFKYINKMHKSKIQDSPIKVGELPNYVVKRPVEDPVMARREQLSRDRKEVEDEGGLQLPKPEVEMNLPTMSGLLAVSRQAGLSGMDKWIKGDRKENTTKAFLEANGIF